jgi:ssDNA-binding Zn-finger/Zn-ribbon topoisomerase 1
MGIVTEDYIQYFKTEIENNNIANNVKGKINIIGVNKKGFIYGEVKSPSTGIKCDVCKIGEIAEKDGKYGKFYSCNKYPDCNTYYVKNKDNQFVIKDY